MEAQKAYTDCPICRGEPRLDVRPCPRCNGEGVIQPFNDHPSVPYGWQVPYRHHW